MENATLKTVYARYIEQSMIKTPTACACRIENENAIGVHERTTSLSCKNGSKTVAAALRCSIEYVDDALGVGSGNDSQLCFA